MVRVTSGAYFSPTRGGKTGVFALLLDSWRCQYERRSEFPNSLWRNCLEIRDSPQFGTLSVGKEGREAPFRSPVQSNIHDRESLQRLSKQFRRGCLESI